MKRGPYVEESGPQVWFPTSDWTFNEARQDAASHAQETIGAWGRSRYLGKVSATCHDCEDWWSCTSCASEPAWAFEMYEGTYRA